MKQHRSITRMAATVAVGAIALTGCAGTGEDEAAQPSQTQTASATPPSGSSMAGQEHAPHGGPPPEGIEKADNPIYPVGTKVILTADHMPGMKGAEATISGAFDTTAYSVTYTPTNGGEPVTNHKWVVHEELKNPGEAPLPEGTEVTLQAEHMTGMKGAEATIESSTGETVYMVDLKINGMKMTNHKWIVESEIKPAQ